MRSLSSAAHVACCAGGYGFILVAVADLMARNALLLALESGWAECCSELGTSYFRPPPHHSASPCAGAVPQGLDAQATELGTCLWAPKYFPSLFLATLAFFGGGFSLIST